MGESFKYTCNHAVLCYGLGLCKIIGKSIRVNLLFSSCPARLDPRLLIACSRFSILYSRRNRELRIESRIETRNGLSTYFWTVLSIVLNWVRLIKFDVWVSHQTCVIWVDLHVNRYKVWYMKCLTLTEPYVFCTTETRS